MSATNGGRGTPPVPPEGHGPPPQLEIRKEVTYRPVVTDAKRTESGGLVVVFLVSEGGEPVRHTYVVGEQGKANIREAANGGIEVAAATDVPEPKAA